MSSSKRTINMTRWGDILKYTHTNYNAWKHDKILILPAIRAYAIITGDNPEPQRLDFDPDDNDDDWRANEAEAVSIMKLFCSPKVHRIMKGIRYPLEMWTMLEPSLHTTGSYIGRRVVLHKFRACRSKEDEPLKPYSTKLSDYCIQLDHTEDTITD